MIMNQAVKNQSNLSLNDFTIAYERGEAGDAELFAYFYAGKVLFDHSRNGWFIWKDHFWQNDSTRQIYQFVTRGLAAQYFKAAAEAFSAGISTKAGQPWAPLLTRRAYELGNLKRVESVLKLAASEKELSISGSEWDIDPLLLGVENGVIDLRTGNFRDGKPEDLIRSHAPVVWEGLDMPCPTWEKFLKDVTGGDQEMIEFFQVVFGHAVDGETTEHKIFIPIGIGRNGKSTLFEVFGIVLGSDLFLSTDADVLMNNKKGGEGPKPFLHSLWGKRVAVAKESSQGQNLNDGLVKSITGGDTLTVRDMYSRPVTFKPTHTLFLMTNNLPHVPPDDQAVWDRIILLPFNQRFVENPQLPNEHQADKLLKSKLEAEKSGILAWLVMGCIQYHKTYSIAIPKAIRDAVNEYRQNEDTVGQFLEECCKFGNLFSIQAGDLFSEYRRWAIDNGESVISNRLFGSKLKKKFSSGRNSHGVYYSGLDLK